MNTSDFAPKKAEAFKEKVVDMLNLGSLALMTSLGHRTGLFDAMSSLPFSTSDEIAKTSGLNERFVREWLGAITTAGIIEHRTAGGVPGLGAMWGKEKALDMLKTAGFKNIRVKQLSHDIQNYYYIMLKPIQ